MHDKGNQHSSDAEKPQRLKQALINNPDEVISSFQRTMDSLGQNPDHRALVEFSQELGLAIHLYPDKAAFYRLRTWVDFHLNNPQQALADISQVIRLQPEAADSYYTRSMFYKDAIKDLPRALEDINQAILLRPDEAKFCRTRGYIYAGLKRYDRALTDFQLVTRLDPQDAEAYHCCGESYLHMEDYPQAIAWYDRAVALGSKDDLCYGHRALAYLKLGEWKQAIADCTEALRLYPDINHYLNRSLALFFLKEYRQAIDDLDEALRRYPGNKDCYELRGWCYRYLNEPQKALADFSQAISLASHDARSVPSYIGRGLLYRSLGKYQEAISDFEQAADRDLDQACHQLEPDEELEMYNDSPNFRRGLIAHFRRQYDLAIQHLEQALQADQRDVLSYYYLGLTYVNLRDFAKVLTTFDRAINLAPPGLAAMYAHRGFAYYWQGGYQQALADYDQATRLNPQELHWSHQRAMVLMRMDNYQGAIAELSRTIQLAPGHPGTYLLRANAYEKVGDQQKALADRTLANNLAAKNQ